MMPDDLEREIKARMALRQFKEQKELFQDIATFLAEMKRMYFEALLKVGFTPSEALALTVAYDPLRPSNG